MLILGLTKTTLLDFPGMVACTVFTGGCNFRCPFCHNGQLVEEVDTSNAVSEEEIWQLLDKRKNVLKGVCISGGEPTLQPDIIDFIKQIKDRGYKVKLDTNGYKPEILEYLLEKKLADYVAMDIKNSRRRYAETTGINDLDFKKIQTSVDLLKRGTTDYEFRTTVVRQYHTQEDLDDIGRLVGEESKWYIQSYKDSDNVLKAGLSAYTDNEITDLFKNIKTKRNNIFLRGIE